MIKDAEGAVVEEYTVDAYFNIKGDGVDANLFEADSPFQVWPTDYLYLTTSEDGGATWSVPSIINMRKESEQSLWLVRDAVWLLQRIEFYLQHTSIPAEIKIVWRFILMMEVRRGKEVSQYQAGVRKLL